MTSLFGLPSRDGARQNEAPSVWIAIRSGRPTTLCFRVAIESAKDAVVSVERFIDAPSVWGLDGRR